MSFEMVPELYMRILKAHEGLSSDLQETAVEIWSDSESGTRWTPGFKLPGKFKEIEKDAGFLISVEVEDGTFICYLTPVSVNSGVVALDLIISGRYSMPVAFDLTPGCGKLASAVPWPVDMPQEGDGLIMIEVVQGSKLVAVREIPWDQIRNTGDVVGCFVAITPEGLLIGWAKDQVESGKDVAVSVAIDDEFETFAFTTSAWNKTNSAERKFSMKLPARYADGQLHSLQLRSKSNRAHLHRSPVFFAFSHEACLILSPPQLSETGDVLTGVAFNPWRDRSEKAVAQLMLADGTSTRVLCDASSPLRYDFLSSPFAFNFGPLTDEQLIDATLVLTDPTGRLTIEVKLQEIWTR